MSKQNRVDRHRHDDTEKHFENGIYQRICTHCGKAWTPPYRTSDFGRPESEREYLNAEPKPAMGRSQYRVPASIPTIEGDTLDRIYAEIPRIACKGQCFAACRAIMLSQAERDAIEALRPIPEAHTANGDPCPMLDTRSHRCTVYAARPLICRIYATTKKLRCPHGCRPRRWLSDEEATTLIARIDRISPQLRGLERDVDELARLGRFDAVPELARRAATWKRPR